MDPQIDFPFEEHLRFGSEDDSLHEPGPKPDWTETTWWSFHVPERALAGWLYAQVRPNIGTVSGGAFVYDPSGWLPWELPYHAWFNHHPAPDPLDLRDVTFRNGVSVRCAEPGMRYRLGYRFRDHDDFVADLSFEGITPPVPHLQGAPPFSGSSHFDQHGRVRGTLGLRGEEIPVDCLAVRDRSWGRRPELVGRRGRLSYCFGASSPSEAFLAFCSPGGEGDVGDLEQLTTGYLLRDGVLRRLESGTRRTGRDAATGTVTRIDLDATDTDGRLLSASAVGVSRMALPYHRLCVNTMLRWSISGSEGSGAQSAAAVGWGEDQDVWPMALFADRHRAPTR